MQPGQSIEYLYCNHALNDTIGVRFLHNSSKHHKMKKNLLLPLLAFFGVFLSSCEAIEGIFKVGLWTGIIIVVLIIAVIIWLINRFRR